MPFSRQAVAAFYLSVFPAAHAYAAGHASAFRVQHGCTAARLPSARAIISLSAQPGDGKDGGRPADSTSADFEMEVLRRRIAMVSRGTGRAFGNDGDDTLGMVTPYSPEDLASCEDVAEGSHLDKLENGWVLLFAPGSEEEGVYTVQDDEDITFVVAFEAKEDAMRFAQQLEAEDFELPSVCQWSMDMLTDFCEMGDYTIGLVPEGVMIMPPKINQRDSRDEEDGVWQPSLEGSDDILGLSIDALTDSLTDSLGHSLTDAPLGGYLQAADQSGAPLELDLAELSRAFLSEGQPSGQRDLRVDAEVIARLDDLFEAESGRPFDAHD